MHVLVPANYGNDNYLASIEDYLGNADSYLTSTESYYWQYKDEGCKSITQIQLINHDYIYEPM